MSEMSKVTPYAAVFTVEHDGAAKTACHDAKMQSLSTKPDDSSECHSSHLSSPNPGGHSSEVLMTCKVVVVALGGHITRARVLLDCTLSTSFVTKSLEHWLQLS